MRKYLLIIIVIYFLIINYRYFIYYHYKYNKIGHDACMLQSVIYKSKLVSLIDIHNEPIVDKKIHKLIEESIHGEVTFFVDSTGNNKINDQENRHLSEIKELIYDIPNYATNSGIIELSSDKSISFFRYNQDNILISLNPNGTFSLSLKRIKDNFFILVIFEIIIISIFGVVLLRRFKE